MEEKVALLENKEIVNKFTTHLRVNPNKSKSYMSIKRVFDIFASLLGLLLLSPVFIILYILMKIENPRAPFFFSQDRVGKNQKKFKMYKIRSMCVDAEEKLEGLLDLNEVKGAMFKMKDDPRITTIGKFIRKYSIDELPQLVNVFKGDMTLVGPRPPLLREVKEYSNYDFQRLIVTPGCTGLWQVSGRNSVGFDEMVKLDLEYISNQSTIFDLKILLKTILVVLRPNSAY